MKRFVSQDGISNILVDRVSVVGYGRPMLWYLLVPLTGLLLAYPTQLTLEYAPIQSLVALEKWPAFAVLYIVWSLLLLSLALSAHEGGNWEAAALVGTFGLVFVGFWLVTGPYTGLRYDGLGNSAHVGYLSEVADGRIPVDHPNLAYFNFPGMHLAILTLVETTGLGVSRGATVALLLHLIILSVGFYALLWHVLRDRPLATFGAIAMIQGNIMLARYMLFPGIWALAFLVMFILFVFRETRDWPRAWLRWPPLIFLGATTITHAVTAILFFFVLAGVCTTRGIHMVHGRNSAIMQWVPILALFLVVPVSWDVYWAMRFFKGIMQIIQAVLNDYAGKGGLFYLFSLSRSYVGEIVPQWAVVVRYVWWSTLLIPGTVLGLAGLLKPNTLTHVQRVATGGLTGVLALSAVATLVSPGGSEFYRLLLYGPLFTVAVALYHIRMLPEGIRRGFLYGLAVLLFALSFPTFLAHNNLVGTATYYSSEVKAADFTRNAFNAGQGWRVFYLAGETGVMQLAVPDALFVSSPQASEVRDENAFWRSMESLLAEFLRSPADQRSQLFYISGRDPSAWRNTLQVDPLDPRWVSLRRGLATSAKLYDNRTVQLFVR